MKFPLSCLLLASICAAAPAHAADRTVRLITPPRLNANLEAIPQIAAPADDAERRINSAIQRLDRSVLKAARACAGGDWERSVQVPMHGPGFLSFVITDSVYCTGNAHPDAATFSIVYDLATGRPVDWTQLLPARLTGTEALEEQGDGSRIVTLASQRLFDLYMAGYRAGEAPNSDLTECRAALATMAQNGPPGMMVWLDAKEGGLAVEIGLPHVVRACEEPVVIPAAVLRSEGAQPALLHAFDARQHR